MNNHTHMYTNYSKITIPKKYNGNNKTTVFLHTRVSSSRWYTIICFIPGCETFYGIPLILPLFFGTNALYWANTILGRMRFAPTIIRPYIRTGESYSPFCIRPIAYTQNYIITTLHYYNITCNILCIYTQKCHFRK